MRIYNLTDTERRGTEPCPQTLMIGGKKIEPGKHLDFPDDFFLGSISGWMTSGWVSVDHLPVWYQHAKRSPKPPPVLKEETKEKEPKSKRSRRKKVKAND